MCALQKFYADIVPGGFNEYRKLSEGVVAALEGPLWLLWTHLKPLIRIMSSSTRGGRRCEGLGEGIFPDEEEEQQQEEPYSESTAESSFDGTEVSMGGDLHSGHNDPATKTDKGAHRFNILELLVHFRALVGAMAAVCRTHGPPPAAGDEQPPVATIGSDIDEYCRWAMYDAPEVNRRGFVCRVRISQLVALHMMDVFCCVDLGQRGLQQELMLQMSKAALGIQRVAHSSAGLWPETETLSGSTHDRIHDAAKDTLCSAVFPLRSRGDGDPHSRLSYVEITGATMFIRAAAVLHPKVNAALMK